MVAKSFADTLDELSERLVLKFAGVGVTIKRDSIGPKHCLKIRGVAQSKLDICPAHVFHGLGRVRASLNGGAFERLPQT
jgi:hypothetical protein